jgi:uncharacterized membrane protein
VITDGGVLAVLAVLGVAAVAGSLALLVAPRRPTRTWEAGALLAASALSILVVAVPEKVDNSGYEFASSAVVYPILFNLLMVGIAVGAIVAGYLNDEVWLVNTGIGFVAADAIARYFDIFWRLMPRSLVFIGFGLLLLGLAFGLERQRSKLVRRIRTS